MKRNAYTRGISIALKVAIVSLAAFYIARRFTASPQPERILEELLHVFSSNPFVFFFVIILMPLNWLLEGIKWKIISSHRVTISLGDAMKGVLAGLTIGTATPNRIGEFAGRIFMIREGDRTELFLLSTVASFCQVAVTVLAGLVALFWFPDYGKIVSELWGILAFVLLLLLAPFLIRFLPVAWREKLQALKQFPARLFIRAFLLSAIRYSVYVFQFLLLLWLVAPLMSWPEALAGITVSYLLVTVIPTFSFTEIFVRGSVAGAVFSGLTQIPVMFDKAFYVAILLWLINVAVPSLVGSVFVFRLKFFKSKSGK